MARGTYVLTIRSTSQGETLSLLGRYQEACDYLNKGLAAKRSLGANALGAINLSWLGRIALDRGKIAEASVHLAGALVAARLGADREVSGQSLVELARYRHFTGDHTSALGLLDEAAEAVVDMYYRHADVLIQQGDVQLAMGDFDTARRIAEQALQLSVDGKLRVRRGQALVVLARVAQAEGEHARAVAAASEAVQIQKETGHAYGEAEAHLVISLVSHDEADQARHHDAAHEIYQRIGAVQPPYLTQ